MQQYSPFLENLHKFFSDYQQHNLKEKIVFAPGTAPMRKGNSEIREILYATDFDVAYFVDPVYGVKKGAIEIDLDEIKEIDLGFKISADAKAMADKQDLGRIEVEFSYENKKRSITFIAGDATLEEYMPEKFNILFSGRRIGMYPGFGLRGTPSHYLDVIVARLEKGGYVIPDRDLTNDADYFFIPPQELGLVEEPNLRVGEIGVYRK